MDKSELMLAERAEAIERLVHRDLQRSRAIERILAPISWILSAAAIVLLAYWLVFDSGLKSLYPSYHTLFVSMLGRMPGQADQVNAVMAKQGFLSLWQIHKAVVEVEAAIVNVRSMSEH